MNVAARTPAILRVNGADEPLETETVSALLEARGLATDGRGIAVALNGRVVRRQDWAATPLSPGDDIEIVTVRQGG